MKVGGSADINHSVCQSNLYLQSQNLEPLFEKFWTNISISAQETLGKSIKVGLSDKKTHFPNAGFVVITVSRPCKTLVGTSAVI